MDYQNDKPNIDYSLLSHDDREALSQAYNQVMSYGHIKESAKKCTLGVTWKTSVQMFTVNQLQWCATLYNQIHDHTYKSKGFYRFWICERGKTRFIQSVHISERCVQKTLNNYGLKPYIINRLIYDNGASLSGKGTEFSLKRLRKHLATHYRKHRRRGGILIIDFHDYFNSIPHSQLLPLIRYAIQNDDIYNLSKYFIDAFGDIGLGLESEISQIAAVYYPNYLDHYIKERLHIKGYGRYMDDIYIIHEDIDYLRYVLTEVKRIASDLGIQLNPKTSITRFESGSFVYLKRRHRITTSGKIVSRLLRTNITKRRRVLKRQKRQLSIGKSDISSIRQSYQSWRGYALKWNSKRSVWNMDRLYRQLFEVNTE